MTPRETAELELDADGLVLVPTCAELGRIGLAREIKVMARNRHGERKEDTRWEISAAGAERIRLAMKHNAEVIAADPILRRRLESEAFRRQ